MTLEIDFETRSPVDLKTHGAYVYFAHPETIALIASYKIGQSPLKQWRHPAPCPDDIRAHIEAGGQVTAHNASFERLLWQMVLTPRFGWPEIALEQFRCTAATAAAMGLPRDLAGLGSALGLLVQKDHDGWRLIRKFSMPRKPRKGEVPGLYWNEPDDFPEDFAKFIAYCDRDVEAEAAADARMVPLSAEEHELYLIDQRINDRGIRVDRRSATAAIQLVAKAKERLDREMTLATGGYVTACSQVAKLVQWVQGQGVEMTSAAKAEIEELLEADDIPDHVRRAVEIRQEAAKTSVSKLEAFLARASGDGRVRGSFLFHAAGTGRWSSTGAQLHNLPRPRGIFGDAHLDQATLFDVIREGDPDLLKFMYGDRLGRPLWLISDAIRGFLWAAPNHDLMVADYSGIEGAGAAWFADEQWKLDAIHELNANPKLPDLYRRAAAGIFNCIVDDIPKSDPRRQVGKVAELSLQYQGGPGAFRSMARNYSLKIEAVYGPVWEAADEERRERAVWRYESSLKRKETTTQTMSREAWIAAELVKIGWRATHPGITGAWQSCEKAVLEAVENPGRVTTALKAQFIVRMGFLWCRLPSGRCLAYGNPRIHSMVWVQKAGEEEKESMELARAEALAAKGELVIEGPAASKVTALGVNSVTKKWERFALYGGIIFQNIIQAICRDLLANGIRKAEAAGYPVVGHVHDEIITEVLRAFGDVKAFEKLICELPAWAEAGLRSFPLKASGYRSKRYKKD